MASTFLAINCSTHTTTPIRRDVASWIPAGDITRLVAFAVMVVDHIGAVFYPDVLVLRLMGRLVYPLFAASLVAGLRRTHGRHQYLTRLALFAILSEYPYMMLFHTRLNIVLTLLAGACCVIASERIRAKWSGTKGYLLIVVLGAAVSVVAAWMPAPFDYSWPGLLLPIALSLSPTRGWGLLSTALFLIASGIDTHSWVPVWGMLTALPAIQVLSAIETRHESFRSVRFLPKYALYAAYPLHMLVLVAVDAAWK